MMALVTAPVLAMLVAIVHGMDMGGTTGDSPTANLPLSDPRCVNESCIAFLNAENESQATISWGYQFEYGHWVTYYYVIITSILTLIHVVRTLRDRRARVDATRSPTSLYQKTVASGRFISCRRVTMKPLARLGLPSFGMLTFLLTTVLFFVILTFAVKPYYRERLGYGSPPLAIRCGLMAFACTPILIALAGKANVVTLLTGISHEKLNVVHLWAAWMSFGLALAHTIPYFLQSYWDGPFYQISGNENVKVQFYAYGTGGGNEYSGVPPLAILFGLCILSLPYIRNRFYGTFYFTHILLGITYLGLLFWHADDILDSWAYLWATLALWLASYLARLFWYARPLNIHSQWFVGAPATLHDLPGGITRIELLAPPGFRYAPSQHCFLRFPAISLLDNHPFTIMSAPRAVKSLLDKGLDDPVGLTFLVRTHTGFTRTLSRYCNSQPDLLASAWIDGPHGGINRPVERLYDTILLIAGGSGISACLPWVLYVTDKTRARNSQSRVRVRRIVLVWAMKDAKHLAWVERDLEGVNSLEEVVLNVQIKFHITGSTTMPRSVTKSAAAEEKDSTVVETASGDSALKDQMKGLGVIAHGRPMIEGVVKEYSREGKTMVLGCGPESMRNDIANACAVVQTQAMKGEVQEVAMHLEAFGW